MSLSIPSVLGLEVVDCFLGRGVRGRALTVVASDSDLICPSVSWFWARSASPVVVRCPSAIFLTLYSGSSVSSGEGSLAYCWVYSGPNCSTGVGAWNEGVGARAGARGRSELAVKAESSGAEDRVLYVYCAVSRDARLDEPNRTTNLRSLPIQG